MSREVRLVDEAVAELEEATEWYEQQSAGLELVFLAAVDRAIDAIVRWPDAGTPVEGVAEDLRTRRTSIARFPYFIAYVDARTTGKSGHRTDHLPRTITAGQGTRSGQMAHIGPGLMPSGRITAIGGRLSPPDRVGTIGPAGSPRGTCKGASLLATRTHDPLEPTSHEARPREAGRPRHRPDADERSRRSAPDRRLICGPRSVPGDACAPQARPSERSRLPLRR